MKYSHLEGRKDLWLHREIRIDGVKKQGSFVQDLSPIWEKSPEMQSEAAAAAAADWRMYL